MLIKNAVGFTTLLLRSFGYVYYLLKAPHFLVYEMECIIGLLESLTGFARTLQIQPSVPCSVHGEPQQQPTR